ncbi:glycosyltransferase family 4 protein [Alkalihalobacillus deserti]|uniref:glycosyltransferase family 4 protein n=1 Tax=Alkalihalobacillus deserti TaxID=2879466 RepID=UPI001D153196|nr:glycosyltransferase family 4 protein [Alkalihalobacillus deserti]
MVRTVAKKILFCATVDYHFKAFHLPYMKWFKEQGWDVHVAASGTNQLPFTDAKFTIPIHRSPFNVANIKAYKELKSIIRQNQYEIIHCHTPLGGVLTRLAAREARKRGTKVIYTAHGFHFCKGAPLANWLVYYPIEKVLSRVTDCLITINTEDYNLATKHQFKVDRIEHVHGVGIDTEKYKQVDKKRKMDEREKLGYKNEDFLMFYAAEFNKNKNQQLLIRALALVKDELPKTRLLLAGEGILVKECQELAKSLGVEHMVDFLGFRKDIDQLLPVCDIAVGSSFREGLPVNIMEAMACGLPVVASENRGHRELILENINGFVIPTKGHEQLAKKLVELYQSQELREKLGEGSISRSRIYTLSQVHNELRAIYSSYMLEDHDEAESKYYHTNL